MYIHGDGIEITGLQQTSLCSVSFSFFNSTEAVLGISGALKKTEKENKVSGTKFCECNNITQKCFRLKLCRPM